MVSYDETQRGQDIAASANVIHVRVKEKFSISLGSNPSTGYVWEPHYNKEILELVSSDFVSNDLPIGSGGVEIFHFLAKAKGEEKVLMLYKKPWEKKPEKKVTYMVCIQ